MLIHRLTIEIDDSPLPRGRVLAGDDGERAFTGWVEFAAAVDAARSVPDSDPLRDLAPND